MDKLLQDALNKERKRQENNIRVALLIEQPNKEKKL